MVDQFERWAVDQVGRLLNGPRTVAQHVLFWLWTCWASFLSWVGKARKTRHLGSSPPFPVCLPGSLTPGRSLCCVLMEATGVRSFLGLHWQVSELPDVGGISPALTLRTWDSVQGQFPAWFCWDSQMRCLIKQNCIIICGKHSQWGTLFPSSKLRCVWGNP